MKAKKGNWVYTHKNNMRILVTGANGYLGLGIIEKLICDGHEVIATDLTLDRVNNKVKKMECNLFEVKNPFEFFGEPEVLIHLAWKDGFVHNSENHILELPGHYQFLKSMIESGVTQLAIMGSMHEVGFYEGCVDEDTVCRPLSLYGIAKNALREMIQLEVSKHNVVFQWLRGYYIVGNSENGSSIFSKIVRMAKAGEKELPFTTGQNKYDFLDYEEFCEQVAAAIGQKKVDGIINICSGIPVKLSERVETFIKENGYDIELKYGVFPERPYDSKAIWGDATKIQLILKDYKG